PPDTKSLADADPDGNSVTLTFAQRNTVTARPCPSGHPKSDSADRSISPWHEPTVARPGPRGERSAGPRRRRLLRPTIVTRAVRGEPWSGWSVRRSLSRSYGYPQKASTRTSRPRPSQVRCSPSPWAYAWLSRSGHIERRLCRARA